MIYHYVPITEKVVPVSNNKLNHIHILTIIGSGYNHEIQLIHFRNTVVFPLDYVKVNIIRAIAVLNGEEERKFSTQS